MTSRHRTPAELPLDHLIVAATNLEQGVACFQSPEYQEAASFRRDGGGIVENVIVEGGDATK